MPDKAALGIIVITNTTTFQLLFMQSLEPQESHSNFRAMSFLKGLIHSTSQTGQLSNLITEIPTVRTTSRSEFARPDSFAINN